MKIHVIRCIVAMALLIGLSGLAAAAPVASIADIPGGQTIFFNGGPTRFTDPNALNVHLAPFGMFSPTALPLFAGVDDAPTAVSSTGNTGAFGPNNVNFGDSLNSTITIETTGLPWIAIGYAGGVTHFFDTESTFSITAYDKNGDPIETVNQVYTANTAVFVGVQTSAFTPIYKVDITFSSLNDTLAWFDNLTFKPIFEPTRELLNDLLTYNGYTHVLNPPVSGCAGGVLALTLYFTYNGPNEFANLLYRLVNIDAPRTLIGANGTDVGIPNANLGPDEKLTPGEAFTGDVSICLPNHSRFFLTLDVYGAPVLDTKRVFVTSTVSNGALGGLAGADAFCQARANAAAIGGTWTAWLSAPGVAAVDRIANAQYVLVDEGTLIAFDLTDLTSGSLIESIFLTELGTISTNNAWTGTAPDGLGTVNTCNAWSSNLNADAGDYGVSAESSALWTLSPPPAACDSMLSLYCFEN